MKTVTKTALANAKQNKGRNFLCGCAIALTTFLIFVVLTVGYGMIRVQLASVDAYYPTYHIMFRQVSEKNTKALQVHNDIEEIGLRMDLGQIIDDDATIIMTATGKNINKKDFMRSWTHSRTAQHISFDEILEEGTTVDGELLFDIADPRSEFESEIIHKFYMEDFKAQLPGVDSKILQMRYDGHSLKEIAAAVGFKTPSAVSKHVEKIAERYDNFISDEYGKLLSKCIN